MYCIIYFTKPWVHEMKGKYEKRGKYLPYSTRLVCNNYNLARDLSELYKVLVYVSFTISKTKFEI